MKFAKVERRGWAINREGVFIRINTISLLSICSCHMLRTKTHVSTLFICVFTFFDLDFGYFSVHFLFFGRPLTVLTVSFGLPFCPVLGGTLTLPKSSSSYVGWTSRICGFMVLS